MTTQNFVDHLFIKIFKFLRYYHDLYILAIKGIVLVITTIFLSNLSSDDADTVYLLNTALFLSIDTFMLSGIEAFNFFIEDILVSLISIISPYSEYGGGSYVKTRFHPDMLPDPPISSSRIISVQSPEQLCPTSPVRLVVRVSLLNL